ncbi:MAG TPA: hypothetical protein VMB80_14970 [Candidatus Acidoferrum sp.]|nr:hypothetical protein [Candidatus Acidoferrum sp.]
MNARAKKILLLLLAAALLFGAGRVQRALNRDREELGLTRASALTGAPPLLAFTTVALGGFRGLISNYLWIRANDLQLDDKFFEAAQLADWITALEPSFAQVWLFQAWNMAYNISVKFKENAPGDYSDRWRWVERGIELLRDDGLRYNPNDILIHRELAWFFQHKMGQNLDDANVYYKQQWAKEMMPFFGPKGTNFSELLHPQTAEAEARLQVFTNKYKLDPAFAEKLNEQYGPLDWRLPEAHAIYWGADGLEKAKANPGKVKAEDLITVRRNIYQSMLQAFYHGRYIANPFIGSYELAPNLDLMEKVNDVYEKMIKADPKYAGNIANAHRNFLRTAVYFLYEDNRLAEAAKWFRYLGEKYPDKAILDHEPDSFPRNLTLDQYAMACVQSDIGETSQDRTTAAIAGLLTRAYQSLALGEDDRYAGFKLLASKIYEHYRAEISDRKANLDRIGLPPFADINRAVLDRLLDPQDGLPYAARAIIRSQLGMLAETNALSLNVTNAPVPVLAPPTNAPATNSAAK